MRNRHGVRCTPRSIVDPFGIPAIHVGVVINPVERIEDFDVPLFTVPHRGTPPITGCVPGSAGGCNRTMHTMKSNPDGTAVAKLDGRIEGRPEPAKGD